MSELLGLYVIVKNGAASIEALLQSIEGVYDEVVIVDTGSTDDTKERIRAFYGAACWDSVGPVQKVKRLALASFEWVDDFSAARQFAFELGEARWRCYLDADDVFPDGKKLRPMLERTEREHPEANIVSMKYAYCDDELPQDVMRLVRWADGWHWEDELHEHMVPEGHARVISKYEDVWVRHHKTQAESNAAFERNVRISEKVFNNPNTPPEKRARFAYFLGDYAAEVGDLDQMRLYYAIAADGLGRCNLGCHTLVRWARMELKHGGPKGIDLAISLAGRAITAAPELPDGWAVLGIGFMMAGQPYRAAGVFDQLWAQPKPPMESMHDAVFLDGITRMHAARAYYQAGRREDSLRMLDLVPKSLKDHGDVTALARPIHAVLSKHEALHRLQGLWEFLIWDAEPLKARELLKRFAPAAISDLPIVGAMRRQTDLQLTHMNDWEAYKRAYAAIPSDIYHVPLKDRAKALDQGRARGLQAWARGLPKDGPPLYVLAIGIHDGLIEGQMLEANSRLHLWVCDVAPQASQGVQELKARFPGRVETHAVVKNHYDWFPTGRLFDAVVLFEVLEHLPSDAEALALIRTHLTPTGVLFLSTPIAESWVEPYLTEELDRPWWHVRAHNPTTLWRLFQRIGFTGNLFGVKIEELFLAAMTPAPVPAGPEINIYIPAWAPPFDPFSAKEGHLGGSEEAVVHLAPALAKLGAKVTVYVARLPERKDKLFVFRGVQWRTHAELDVRGLEGTLLVWRSPTEAAALKRRNPELRVLNHMHDVGGGATPAQYEAVDGTLILSLFHADAIAKTDGYSGPFLDFSNGIDPAEFPVPDESKRDPHLAIYASAPNRGLDMLLAVWPRIRSQVPDARLRIFYGWELTEKMMERSPALKAELGPLLAHLRAKFEELKDQGVEYIGGVSHAVLNAEYRSAGVWAYPCYGEAHPGWEYPFEEVFCISAIRAQASGCWPVTMDSGSLPEVVLDGAIVPSGDVDAFVDAVVAQMLDPGTAEDRATMREGTLERWSWAEAAEKLLTHAKAPNERISIFCGVTMKAFDGCSLDEQLGGSEEAVVLLARELARRGKEVFVYTKLPAGGARGDGTSINWRTSDGFVPAAAHGTLLAWRCPHIIHQLKGNGYPVILWLMDPDYGTDAEGFELADDVVFLTNAHREITCRKNGFTGPASIVPICLPELPEWVPNAPRDPHAVMWATSPDRGLLEFLKEVWPGVKAAVPNASLHIYYGLEPLRKAGKGALADAIEEEISELADVSFPQGVPRAVLEGAFRSCGVFAYRSLGFEETQCCHPDTRIAMPGDHTSDASVAPRIADLVGRENFPVYAYDASEHRFRIALAKRVWMTKIADEMVELGLEDGHFLRLTPEHPVMDFDGEWVPAGELEVGHRLMALHYRYDVRIKDANGGWVAESRLVGEWLMGRPLRADEHVDHVGDPTRVDNRPGSLRVLTASEHARKTHSGKKLNVRQKEAIGRTTTKRMQEHPTQMASVTASIKRTAAAHWAEINAMSPEERVRYLSERGRNIAAAVVKHRSEDPEFDAYMRKVQSDRGKKGGESIAAMTPEQRAEYHRLRMAKAVATRRERYGPSGRQNHRVVSVRHIPGGPVYDMEVEGLHNFIADGVVVHNCLTAIRAAALGCWPVVNATGALPEVLEGYGTVVPVHRDYATALIDLLNTSPADAPRRLMAEAMRERFSAELMGDRMMDLIRKVKS